MADDEVDPNWPAPKPKNAAHPPIPGWYPDANAGRARRFWDGSSRWAASTRPAPGSRFLKLPGRAWVAVAVCVSVIAIAAGAISWWTDRRSEQQLWSQLPHTMGCTPDPEFDWPIPPGPVKAQQVALEHLGGRRIAVSVTFAEPPPPAPVPVRTPYGELRNPPGSLDYSIDVGGTEGDASVVVHSPSDGDSWRAVVASNLEPLKDGPEVRLEVSIAGNVLRLALDLDDHPQLLNHPPYAPPIRIFSSMAERSVLMRPEEIGVLFRDQECDWSTPAQASPGTIVQDEPGPPRTATPPPPMAVPDGVPGTDTRGFVDYPGTRCDEAGQVMLAERTNESVLVICRGASGLYYRGTRLSDGASITLNDVVAVPGGFDARNAADGTRYEVRSTGLTILSGSQVFVEPAVDFWASGTGTPSVSAPGTSPNPAQYVRTTSGLVRCVVTRSEVACERRSASGFPQAPVDSDGNGHWNLAIVDSAGEFRWGEGNIGGADINQDVVLGYGHAYRYNGWTINAASDGTRFRNDNTKRGMFVSVENIYPF